MIREGVQEQKKSAVGKYLQLFLAVAFFIALLYFVYFVFFKHTIYVDAETLCRIDIHPSIHYKKSDIVEAIGVVKEYDTAYYEKLCSYVTAIDDEYCMSPVYGYTIMGCSHGGSRIGLLVGKKATAHDIASILVHETCHFENGHTRTQEDYQDITKMQREDEKECYAEGDAFFNKVEGLVGEDAKKSPAIYPSYQRN
jgi:hypothetical protein